MRGKFGIWILGAFVGALWAMGAAPAAAADCTLEGTTLKIGVDADVDTASMQKLPVVTTVTLSGADIQVVSSPIASTGASQPPVAVACTGAPTTTNTDRIEMKPAGSGLATTFGYFSAEITDPAAFVKPGGARIALDVDFKSASGGRVFLNGTAGDDTWAAGGFGATEEEGVNLSPGDPSHAKDIALHGVPGLHIEGNGGADYFSSAGPADLRFGATSGYSSLYSGLPDFYSGSWTYQPFFLRAGGISALHTPDGTGDTLIAGSARVAYLHGSNGADTMTGGAADDVFEGYGGADTIDGQGGRNAMSYADDGHDGVKVSLNGQRGSGDESDGAGDLLLGIRDVFGSPGKDRLTGDSQAQTLSGLGGKDRVLGKGGNDRLAGGAGNDRVSGGGGKDSVNGNAGRDTLLGGAAKDTLLGGSGTDTCIGPGDKRNNCEASGAGNPKKKKKRRR